MKQDIYEAEKRLNEHFLDCLAEAMNAKGMERKDLVEATGINRFTISSWERKASTPSTKYLRRLCVVLNVSPSYFLGLPALPDKPQE